MKIVVFAKRVPDTGIPVQVNKTGNDIDRENLQYVVNPYDEFAVEEALRIKEKIQNTEILAVSLGPDDVKETLRHVLALGADRAVHLKTESYMGFLPANVTAGLLYEYLKGQEFDILLMGKEAVDDNQALVPSYLSVMLGIPLISYAVKVEVQEGSVKVVREIDDGHVEVESKMPVIITAEKGLNEPRLPTLRGIMMSKRKTIEEIPVELPENYSLKLEKMEMPPQKEAGIIIQEDFPGNVDKLLKILREKKVL